MNGHCWRALLAALLISVLGAAPPVVAQTVQPQIGSGWQSVVIPTAPAAGLTTASLPAGRAKPPVGVHALDGIASYYWQEQMTANGERFDKRAMTAAHKTLPFGTKVRVTHVASGRTVIVRINDRGPFKPGRVIDLSQAAAEQLQMTGAGLAHVKIDVVN